ncbi:MAG: hypothetical protein HKN43_06995 [Rhodothermales bacterium]|nr:hypothetical protein [Rhodothermales bacterium]
MKYSNYIHCIVILIVALTWTACDSNDPDPPENDDASALFFGDWNLTGANDDSGSRLGDLANRYNFIEAEFATDTTFALVLDSNNETVPDVNLTGTFNATLSESLMRLMADFNGTPVSLTFGYEFTDESQQEVAFMTTTSQTDVLNLAIGTDFSGPTTLTFSRIED